MGFGTGVRIAIYPIYLIYGVTVGVAGTNIYFIAQKVGMDQSLLATSRGIGMCLGPFFFSRMIGRLVWRGEPMTLMATILLVKGVCFLVLPDLCSHVLLMLALFTAGVMMSLVYVATNYIAGQCYGEDVGGALIFYGAFYQLGAMVAPLIAVRVPDSAWSIVAGVDFIIAAWLFVKRFVYGKPKDWKSRACRVPAGLRGARGASPAGQGREDGLLEYSRVPVPRQVLGVGVLFNFVCQVAQTSISCWGFTWAVTALGLPNKEAAMVPSTFSLGFMLTRFAVVLPASRRVLPSAIVHAGVIVTLVGCTVLHLVVQGAGEEEEVSLHLIQGALFLVGAGLCPHQAMVLSSMLRHGRLEVHEVGYYSAAYNMGTTVGMWLPGVVPLHRIVLPCSVGLVFLVNVSFRYFPRWGGLGARPAPGEAPAPSRASSRSSLPCSSPQDLARRFDPLIPTHLLPKVLAKPRVLIVSPTKELAAQIWRVARDLLSPFPQLNTTLLIGGNSHAKQDEALKFDRPVVVVGTPGRILDHCEEGRLVFEALKVVVFDEVDALFTSLSRKDHLQMLVERTMEGTEAQKILASATGATSEELAEFAEQHLRKPWLDSPWLGVEMPLGVLHLANGAPDIPKKLKFLQRLTSSIEPEPTGILVFCNNVERVRKVLQELRRMGIPSQALTGNRSAAERVDAIKNLGKGVIEVIVCTDVASRGLDFKELSHVVNFEMPPDAHAYAHRAGRVGRAGKSGIVISLGGGGSENNRLTNYANELGITVHECNVDSGLLQVYDPREDPHNGRHVKDFFDSLEQKKQWTA